MKEVSVQRSTEQKSLRKKGKNEEAAEVASFWRDS